jgi:hypothetical protein
VEAAEEEMSMVMMPTKGLEEVQEEVMAAVVEVEAEALTGQETPEAPAAQEGVQELREGAEARALTTQPAAQGALRDRQAEALLGALRDRGKTRDKAEGLRAQQQTVLEVEVEVEEASMETRTSTHSCLAQAAEEAEAMMGEGPAKPAALAEELSSFRHKGYSSRPAPYRASGRTGSQQLQMLAHREQAQEDQFISYQTI